MELNNNNNIVKLIVDSKEVIILAFLNLIIQISFIYFYPAIYNWDAVNRIINHDQILVAHWLPGLQSIIYLIYKLKLGLIGLRVSLILISLCAAIALYLFMNKQFNKRTAFIASLLFMTSPILLTFSIVPYQEMLMFCFIFVGLYLHLTKYKRMSYFFLGASCLVRYEAWIFCFLFAMREIYIRMKDRNIWNSLKMNFVNLLILFWGVILVLILKIVLPNNLVNLISTFEHNPINITLFIKILFIKISSPIIFFIFAVLGIIYSLKFIKSKKQKSLWFIILLFFLIDLLVAGILINKYPSCCRVFLIANTIMFLFVALGINLIYIQFIRNRKQLIKKIFYLSLILVLFYMLFINLNTANNYFKLTYKHTNFDEYYAVSKVIKKYPHQNILVIEPPNFGKFKVTSIYLKNQKNAYIYPSLNYTILELKTLFEENDFSKILKIGHSEDNINEVIEDMGLNINVQSVKS